MNLLQHTINVLVNFHHYVLHPILMYETRENYALYLRTIQKLQTNILINKNLRKIMGKNISSSHPLFVYKILNLTLLFIFLLPFQY